MSSRRLNAIKCQLDFLEIELMVDSCTLLCPLHFDVTESGNISFADVFKRVLFEYFTDFLNTHLHL